MKQSEIIRKLTNDIASNAYMATCCDALSQLGFEARMMEYDRNVHNGKAFEAAEIMRFMSEKSSGDDIYKAACEEAQADIKSADGDIVKILDLAGYDGKAYFECVRGQM